MVMICLFLISAVYSFGQEQDSPAIIGEWLQVGRDDDDLIIISFTNNQITIQNLQYDFSKATIGYTINNGTLFFHGRDSLEPSYFDYVFYGRDSPGFNLIDNDTLSIGLFEDLTITFKRLHQDILLSGIFYESDGNIFNDYHYIEFVDGQRGKRSLYGFIFPFEYEIHGIYLIMKITEEYQSNIFIIKSDSIIEEYGEYGGFIQDSIFRKK
jgi:hypothetical protein